MSPPDTPGEDSVNESTLRTKLLGVPSNIVEKALLLYALLSASGTQAPLRDGHEVRQDIFLRKGATISGRVTRADTGAPVKGVTIMAVTLNKLWFAVETVKSPMQAEAFLTPLGSVL